MSELRAKLLEKEQELARIKGTHDASIELAETKYNTLSDKQAKERKKQKQAFERLTAALEDSTKSRHKWKKKYHEEKAARESESSILPAELNGLRESNRTLESQVSELKEQLRSSS